MAKVLVIGSEGREHALAWKLGQSAQVSNVFVSPGNAGTRSEGKISSVDIDVKDFDAVAQWCKDMSVALVVVGPEDPLANGLADTLKREGISCFGPSAKAAQIESSKEFAKAFMDRHKIPTARWMSFKDAEKAANFINESDFAALVVKASGLAAGKGVIVAKDKEEACGAVREMLTDGKFGSAGRTVVVEELLEGEEVSCLAFSDGKSIACLPPAQDHKRAYEGDKGPNTGGMGAYSPWPLLSDDEVSSIKKDILQKAIDGLNEEGFPFVGVLYAGLMLTSNGPKVLEFNCRFGDPETQVLLSLLESDLYEIMQNCVNGTLPNANVKFFEDQHSVAVVLASEGYPGSYKKGLEITDIEKAEKDEQVTVFHAGTCAEDNKILTSGGRVLAVVATEKDFASAVKRANQAAGIIQFQGKQYRKDIGHKAMKHGITGLSYKDSGVDIEAGDRLVDAIKPLAAMTSRLGCSAELGMFGGLFDMKAAGYIDPLLVSGTDGVGTKLKVAQQCNQHSTVGIDLVAMCVNDVLAHGAEPLFFLDYFACGKLDVEVASSVVKGVAEGCQQARCALLGGETAEMPGMYKDGEYDLAGFTVGAVERKNYLPRLSDIKEGDVVIGLRSSGVHSNGFSLIRKIVHHAGVDYHMPCPFEEGKLLGSALLTPTSIYCRSVLPPMKLGLIKAFAHITGGGLPGNVPRILPKNLGVTLDAESWTVPPVFGWLANTGNVSEEEMLKTFNCGIGAVLVVEGHSVGDVLQQINGCDDTATVIGQIVQCISASFDQGCERVMVRNIKKALKLCWTPAISPRSLQLNGISRVVSKKRVGVLISGSGTNLQALIDHVQNSSNNSSAEIVLVISNKSGVKGLERAQAAGIQTKVISHKEYKDRAQFDGALHAALEEARVNIVCLAGFMRILTGSFVRKWEGRMLNVHPSLLPSFKGANAHKLVLEANVRISGCTVHFVAEEVDAGAILVQESVPVFPDDTEETLAERVKTVEHKAFPKALELVASGKAVLKDNKITWKL